MSRTIHAIFDAGVFRPLGPVNWPDGTRAEVIVIPSTAPVSTDEPWTSATWPAGYFEQTAGVLAGEDFERCPQGDLPARENW